MLNSSTKLDIARGNDPHISFWFFFFKSMKANVSDIIIYEAKLQLR